MPLPTLETGRLILRPFTLDDAPRVTELAGAAEVADSALHIPHPYRVDDAKGWIGTHAENAQKGTSYELAVMCRTDAMIIGAMSIRPNRRDSRGEIGYWIGVPYWGQGYATEAGRAIFRFGFEVLNLNRIYAMHFARNPASGRVMQKLGMTHEGCQRQHIRKGDHFEDAVLYGILRAEWSSMSM
jgi:ribosomal-protein-alanine N-acetyltransferase